MPSFALPPVSYSQQVAPVLALHCYSCHGDSGGLSLRRYAELRRGGNLGQVVIPGSPDRSLLIHFVEGRRGPAHRMPLDGKPLSPEQIRMIRRWIAEGAKADARPTPRRVLTLRRIGFGNSKTVRVFCRLRTPAYLTLSAYDPRQRRRLFTEVATVKSPRDRGDAAQPGEMISWDIHAGIGWPKALDVQLTIEYSAAEPKGTEFFARAVQP